GEGYNCDPDSLRLHPIQLTISSDGNKLSGSLGDSPVSYTRVSTSSTDLTLPLIGIGGASAAAVTGGYAVKKIVKKHAKPHEKEAKEKLPVIRLGIECGIEGVNVEEAIAQST